MADARTRFARLARRALFEDDRRRGARRWIEASGTSMRPLIAPGTWMLVEFGARPEGAGEIAVHRRGDAIVAHRVVRTIHREAGTFVVTKGDAERRCDLPVAVDDVIGVVRALRRAPGARATTFGCNGSPARAIAWISDSGGRAARLVRRLPRFLPVPLRRLARTGAPRAARARTRLVAEPLALATTRPGHETRREVTNGRLHAPRGPRDVHGRGAS